MIPEIRIEDFNYPLPDSRIAKYPLPQRDASKLLFMHGGKIEDHVFSEIPTLLDKDSLMVFNETRVVPARLHFQRETGAHIEIFCLEPVEPSEYNLSFAASATCRWKCVIGNSKRWKSDILHLYNPLGAADVERMNLRAALVKREGETGIVDFSWDDGAPFSRVLEVCGTIPIPPYLNRESEAIDSERYQTLYARIRGSVAAPTAGLHFTDKELNAIIDRGILIEKVCLHVGAGTFLPVKSEFVSDHPMHREPFTVSLGLLKEILHGGRKVTAVGTTSVRTLESLYYAGVKCIENGAPSDIEQWEPYARKYSQPVEESLGALVKYLEDNSLDELTLGTRIIILPGFKWRLTDRLVTNFHQPESTLLLLVSSFTGGQWRPIYDHALANGYRFLSYGDSSLLERKDIC